MWLLCLDAAAQQGSPQNIDIPAQPLAAALKEFGIATDSQVMFSREVVAGQTSTAVKGSYAPEEALAKILRSTHLRIERSADNVFLVKAPAAGSPPSEAEPRNAVPPDAAFSKQTQARSDSARNDQPIEAMIVTGTWIRGVAPAGTSVIDVSKDDIAASGVSTTFELMKSIPQMSQFLAFESPLSSPANVTVQRPALRTIPNIALSSTSPTLILVDGHRIVNVGVRQTAVEPEVIPPGVIERVEIMPDGGSATYGTDAIAGVINIITKRRFDGIEADVRYGFGEDYHTIDAYGTLGHAWQSGSAYVSYSHSNSDAIFGRDRDYSRRFAPAPSGEPNPDVNCNVGTVRIGATNYALPGLVPNTANRCDISDNTTLWPEKERDSVFAGFSQDIGESVDLDVRGYYSENSNSFFAGLRSSVAITAANPFYRRTVDNPAPQAARAQSVLFDWAPLLGPTPQRIRTTVEAWGLTPTLTFDLGDWQIRSVSNFGESTTEFRNKLDINSTALAAAARATTVDAAFNPYDLSATNPAVIANILNWTSWGTADQKMFNQQVIADGSLLEMPGGTLRVAIGVEYMRESINGAQLPIVPGTEHLVPRDSGKRNNRSVFGELSIPLVGPQNAFTAVQALELSLSGRYDDYSDFGDTTNPKIGFTYQPVSSLKLRGSWSTSFNAPSLVDSVAVRSPSVTTSVPASSLINPLPGQFDPSMAGWRYIIQGGVKPGITPQEGESYELGVDFTPDFLPRSKFGVTYYHIDVTNQISSPPFGTLLDFYRYYQPLYLMFPTEAQVRQFLADGGVPQATINQSLAGLFDPGATPIYAIAANVRQNLGNSEIGGLDFDASYVHPTSFGSLDASLNATYVLQEDQQALPGAPWIDNTVADINRFKSQASVGATIGELRAQLTWNHRHGYDITPTAGNNFQASADSFDILNLFFQYQLSGPRLLEDTKITLGINDVLDQAPPFYKGSSQTGSDGFVNGFSVGRVIQLGINIEL